MVLNKKDEVSDELRRELKDFQMFLKRKKISCEELSKVSGYSLSHLIRIFNGNYSPTDRFMKSIFFAAEKILQRDLNEFHNLIIGTSWATFLLDSMRYKRNF